MKKIFLLITLLLFAFGVQSQNITVDWLSESKAKNGMNPKNILGEFNNEIYLLKDDYSSAGRHHYYSLETYSSSDMMLTNSIELKLPDIHERGDQTMIRLSLMKNGNLVLFFDNEKMKLAKPYAKTSEIEYKCYAALIDNKAKAIGEPQLIYEDEQSYKVGKEYTTKKCNVILSTDSTRFFMYSGNVRNKRLSGKIFDSDLKQLKVVSYEFPLERSFSISNLIFDENQILYGVCKENTAEIKKYAYKIIALNLTNYSLKSSPIDIKTELPLSRFHMSKANNRLQIVGYYFAGLKKKTTGGGILFYEFNASDLKNQKSFSAEYDPKVITQLNCNSKFLKDYTMYDTANAITSLVNSKFIHLKNGETIVLSEQVVELDLASTSGDDYFNILVTRITKDGIINNPYVIPKLQSGKSKSYYSFLDMVKNDKLFLIYNDNSRNEEQEDPYKSINGLNGINGSSTFIVSFTDDSWSKKLLFPIDADASFIHPAKFLYRNANEILIYGQKENKIKFALIKL
ncbi:MAG: hypothetical protein V4580_14920 [Bacteroidota bacterium]